MTDRLLALYDDQLRTTAEVGDAEELTHLGPLWLATYPRRRRGFITYTGIGPEHDLGALVDAAAAHFAADDRIDRVEWKTRGHDDIPHLLEVLSTHGFHAGEPETVMAGDADAVVAAASPLPSGYRLERAVADADIRAAEALAGQVFGDTPEQSTLLADQLVARMARDPEGCEVWLVRDADGAVVCSGRVDMVPDSDFAGLWGGACDAAHRGRGLYRALTAARARSALGHGRRYLHSDCTEFSRPILQRAGLVPITTTTPVLWRRPGH